MNFFFLSSVFWFSPLSFSLSPFFLTDKMSRHFVVSCLSTVPILSPSSAPSQGFKAHLCQGPIGKSQSQILRRQTGPAAKQPSGFALPRTLYQSIPSISLPRDMDICCQSLPVGLSPQLRPSGTATESCHVHLTLSSPHVDASVVVINCAVQRTGAGPSGQLTL